MADFLVLIVIVFLVIGGAALYRRRAIAQREAEQRREIESQVSTSKRAALAQADQVVVLLAGEAAARGTWQELESRWAHLAG